MENEPPAGLPRTEINMRTEEAAMPRLTASADDPLHNGVAVNLSTNSGEGMQDELRTKESVPGSESAS